MHIIIPIRSGSKRLKNKNISLLNGKPLVHYSIEAAINSKITPSINIIVSSDSQEYLDKCSDYPITLHLRSASQSADSTSTYSSIISIIDQFDIKGDIMLLQATSPFRSNHHIEEAFSLFSSNKKPVVSVTKKNMKQDDFSFINNTELKLNGAIYIMNSDEYRKSESFVTSETLGYIMSAESSIDIDEESDLLRAEEILKRGGII